MKIALAIDPGQPLEAYRGALLAAGALPGEVLVVQPGDPLPAVLDGLLLSGGLDVDPVRYGQAPVNATVETNPGRDALDFALLERALERGAPVFGICRGLQVLNVAFGGSLWQDLPSQRPGGVAHDFPRRAGNDPAHPAHVVHARRGVDPRLPLASALAASEGVLVNSRHHQAVRDLAPGLVALASSPDDLVEALALEGGPFVAAVQWHPENLVGRADQLVLFEEFLAAARDRAARGRESASRALLAATTSNDSAPSGAGERRHGGAPEPE